MFFRLFCYRLKQMVRNRGELFWTMLFPLILGTMFYFTFGNMLEGEIDYEPAKTAVVLEEEGSVGIWFKDVLESENIDEIMIPEIMEEKEAVKALENGKVAAVIYATDSLTMKVGKTGLDSTVLKIFLDTCLHNMDLAMNGTDITKLTTDFVKEGSLTKGNGSGVIQYFYALIAMAALYGCFSGRSCVYELMPNCSHVGARRSVAPMPKLLDMISSFTASVFMQVVAMLILVFYLTVILKIDLGYHFVYMLLVLIAGSMIGVAYGFFIGSFSKLKEGVQTGLLLGVTMGCCFFSGLMFSSMKGLVEKKCPIFNRINPAALITDAFYALSMEEMERYYKDLGILAVFAVVLVVICVMKGRREKFASI